MLKGASDHSAIHRDSPITRTGVRDEKQGMTAQSRYDEGLSVPPPGHMGILRSQGRISESDGA